MNYIPTELIDFDVESLGMGRGTRLHHMECSAHKHDKTLSITRDPEGLVYHCYRCGVRGIIRTHLDPVSAARYLRRRTFNKERDPDLIELPWDFVPMCKHDSNIHPKAYAWLYKYELKDSDLCTYNIGFSRKLQRVILPIYQGFKLIGWVGRDIHYKKGYHGQKYHNEFQGDGRVYFDSSNGVDNLAVDSCVYVEDIISAIKVTRKLRMRCIALLNTSIGDDVIRDIMRGYGQNFLWLDQDARVKALRQIFKYKQMGINITTISTNRDPKDVPLAEIPSCLRPTK